MTKMECGGRVCPPYIESPLPFHRASIRVAPSKLILVPSPVLPETDIFHLLISEARVISTPYHLPNKSADEPDSNCNKCAYNDSYDGITPTLVPTAQTYDYVNNK